MRTRSRDDFTTIRTEGQILPPDLLTRIVERDKELEGLDPSSYHLVGQTLNEAISRSWSVLQGVWAAFKERRADLPKGQPETQMTRERWLLPLFRELDYGRLETMRAVEIEGKSYPISHRWQHAPIHLVGFRTDLDQRTPGVAGAARISPHGLVQEFLNRSDETLWGFLSDGLRLRILRDNAALTRQAYVEFDLEAMMDGEVYPDFVLLWLLCHQSRVEAGEARPEKCHLEKWSHAAAQQGTRALEGLRDGVEEAISSLGSGFISHRANDGLRARLRSGELDTQDYYRQLLRLVYRLLFLFVAEDRELLLDPDADDVAKERFARFYSTRKLRGVAEKRVGARHSDLYRMLSLVMEKLGDERGYPELGLPALGSFLFGREAMPDLTGAEVSNRDLLEAVRALSYTVVDGGYRAVDYKNLGAEELGSVYESLLELQPDLDPTSGTFTLRAVTGNERKTTGSYYTPHSLVTSLIDTALDPVLDEAAEKSDPEAAILALKVCDPAVGSGHFLIAAAHRMAKRLASVRTGDDEPSPEATREALRDVIGRCLYGVDVNPMAAELCRVSLWMEALVPGRPLSFLDHHIRVGNSLLGTTPELIADGIPNDAFRPIEGDDKQLTNTYKKRNREERMAWESGQLSFSLRALDRNREVIERGYKEVEEGEDSSVAAVREKATRYAALQDSEEMFHARRLADAWCAAFVWPKWVGAPDAITQQVFAELTQVAHSIPRETEEEIERIADRYNLFHWHLAFPNVFDGKGGFDVVLGNPPWGKIKLQEKEWFAAHRPEIATAPNAAARKRMIERLKTEDSALNAIFREVLRIADGESHLLRNGGRYPLCGRGDINTYSVFVETKRSIVSPIGRIGCIVPSGIATDDTTKFFFADLVSTNTLVSLFDFWEVRKLFIGTDQRSNFCLLTLTGLERPVTVAEFVFFAHSVAELSNTERSFTLTAEDIVLLNPNTRTCPIFRTRRDAEINKAIYRRVPVLVNENEEGGDGWSITFLRMFDMANDSGHFHTRDKLEADDWRLEGNIFVRDSAQYLPIYEAKMIWQYDHRRGSFAGFSVRPEGSQLPQATEEKYIDAGYLPLPWYWIEDKQVASRLNRTSSLKLEPSSKEWFLAYRFSTSPTNERTMVSSVIPRVGVNHILPCIFSDQPVELQACLLGNVNSFAYDYLLRNKMGRQGLDHFFLKQAPCIRAKDYTQQQVSFVAFRVLELTYTAWDLESFAQDLGYDGPPFHWDPERRFLLRCELDAAFFHLYGIERDDVDYIMETFPIVKRKDEAAHGEYRTKRVILEIYDQMAHAAETGQPYQTSLDPPPVSLDFSSDESAPSTVTSLRPHIREPERTPPAEIAAEEKRAYRTQAEQYPSGVDRTETEALVDAIPEDADFSQLAPERRGSGDESAPDQRSGTPPEATLFPENEVETQNAIPSIGEAVNVLHACVPDGEKVQREQLLFDSARELGHAKLTRKVRRTLNQALNAEHNAGRLKTDWQLVWKPRKK